MEKIYYDPSNPGSFSSIANLSRAAGVSLKDAKKWLLSQDVYTLHRLGRKNFPRNRYFVDNIDDLWEADLCCLGTLSKYNDGFNFILTVIDVFSKFAWVVPLKTKHNKILIDAFKSIFERGRKCLNLQTDKGKEFVGKEMKKFMLESNVNFYTTKNPDVKAAVVERFNRTLKQKMWKFLTHMNSFRYIDRLADLVHSYNHSYHSSIKMRPVDVNETNILQVWKNLHKIKEPKKEPNLKINTFVRIGRKKSMFEKGYETNFTEEIFKIIRVIKRPVPVYELEDFDGEKIDGLFYEHELQPVTVEKGRTYKIDKVIGRRLKGGIRQVLVSWKGYPAKFNSWIPASDLKSL